MDNLQACSENNLSGIRRAKELEEWINAMPIDWQALAELKKYLQVEIEQYGCQQAMQLTARFLRFHFPEDQKEVLGWLMEQGISCDCKAAIFISKLAPLFQLGGK